MNLFSLLELSARRHREAGAIFVGAKQVRTWGELRDRALRLGAGLGLPPGSRVAIAAGNCPEYLEIVFGAWSAGLIVAPVNAKLSPREMAEIVEDSGAAVLLASDAIAEAMAIHPGFSTPMIRIGGAAYGGLLEADPRDQAQDVSDDAVAWLFFTSGTTGRSKGAMLTHRNLRAMTIAHLADFEAVEPEHAIIHAAPMSHGSGLYILPYVARGARHVIPASGGFEPAEFLALCAHHGGAGAFLVPTMVNRLRASLPSGSTVPPSGLRRIFYGGAPMYLEDLKKAMDVFGPILCQLYGQGEAPMTITGLPAAAHVNASEAVLMSVGWPRSGVEVAVRDANGREVPSGTAGEVTCRGDVVMAGYWNDPMSTAAALKDGWLLTGDVGVVDESGCLSLRDRSKDVVISGGSNIYPREVEEVLLTCVGVVEASVVGAPDSDWGEVPVAFVVVDPQVQGVDADTLDRHCLAHIARFKRPKRYVFIETLPKSSYGKILKRELVERLAREHTT